MYRDRQFNTKKKASAHNTPTPPQDSRVEPFKGAKATFTITSSSTV